MQLHLAVLAGEDARTLARHDLHRRLARRVREHAISESLRFHVVDLSQAPSTDLTSAEIFARHIRKSGAQTFFGDGSLVIAIEVFGVGHHRVHVGHECFGVGPRVQRDARV